jgi:hypothetical protein
MTFKEWWESPHLKTFLYLRRTKLAEELPGPLSSASEHLYNSGRWKELEELEKFLIEPKEAEAVSKTYGQVTQAAQYFPKGKI